MKVQPKLLDTIALLQALPYERLTLTETESMHSMGLPSGLVGTIVHVHDQINPPQYLIEFSDSQGCEYAMATLQETEFLVLQYDLIAA
ncbi:MAG TPA: DUF4926 domain-containing protein [Stenomitos sp.]